MVFLNPGAFGNHPPGLQLLFYPFVLVFGANYYVLKILTLLLTSFSLAALYFIGKKLGSPMIGFCSSVAYFFIPIIFIHSNRFLGDTVLASFTLLFFFLIIYEEKNLALIIGLFLGFLRQSSLAFGIAALFYYALRKELNKKTLLICASPFITLGLFFVSQKIQLGSFIAHDAFKSLGHISIFNNFSEGFRFSFEHLFENQGKFYAFVTLVISFVLSIFYKKIKREKFVEIPIVISLVVSILIFLLFFSFNTGTIQRYFNPLLPFFMTLTFYFSFTLLQKFTPLLLIFFLYLFYPHYNTDHFYQGTGYETTLQYKDIIRLHQLGADYLSKNHPNKIIGTGWPLNSTLIRKEYGYVEKELQTEFIDRIFIHKHLDKEKFLDKLKFEIFYWSSSSALYFTDNKQVYIDRFKLKLIQEFKYKQHSLEFYQRIN